MAKTYFWQPPRELGMSGGGSRELRYQVGGYFTKQEIQDAWNADEGMGYFKESFGDDFNKYFNYIDDQQKLIDEGKLPELITNWERIVESGVIGTYIEQLRRGEITTEEYDKLVADQTNTGWMAYRENPEYQDLINKHNIPVIFQNDDGDLFEFNGSNYTKTLKIDDHPGVADYAGALMKTVITAAATWGVANASIGTTLNNFFTAKLGMSGAAASAATSSVVSSGIQGVLGEELTVEGVLGSAVGAGLGTQFSQLGMFSDLSAATTSAIASASASTIEQAIANGSVDLETVITSGALGGGLEIGKDLFSSLSGDQAFTFGGLVEEGSSTFELFNGQLDPTSGKYVGGIIGDTRGAFNKFVEQNITGGQWWEGVSEQYDSVEEFANGEVVATLYDGSEVTYDSMQDFIKASFTEVEGNSDFFDLFTTGVDIGTDAIDSVISVIPDSWFDALEEWINEASSGSGSHTTEGGTTITTPPATTGSGENNGGNATFDCATVNRVQTADASTEEACGPCIEGFQSDEFGKCISADTVETCPEGQVYNEVAGACVDEVFFTPGQPCNTSDGQQGIFDDDGGCYVPTTGTGSETGGPTNTTCGEGEEYNEETQKCEVVTTTTGTGNPEPCTGNNIRDAQGNCVDPLEVLCSGPRPTEYGFEQINWDKNCGGTPVTGGPNNGTPPPPEDCPEGQTRNAQGECEVDPVVPPPPPPPPGSPCAQQNRSENEDGSCGECLPGYMIDPKGFDQCVPTGIPVTPPPPPAPPPAPSGSGSVGGGGTGMFKPANVSMGYNRTPELVVQNKPFTDYAGELDGQIQRLLTQRNKDIV